MSLLSLPLSLLSLPLLLPLLLLPAQGGRARGASNHQRRRSTHHAQLPRQVREGGQRQTLRLSLRLCLGLGLGVGLGVGLGLCQRQGLSLHPCCSAARWRRHRRSSIRQRRVGHGEQAQPSPRPSISASAKANRASPSASSRASARGSGQRSAPRHQQQPACRRRRCKEDGGWLGLRSPADPGPPPGAAAQHKSVLAAGLVLEGWPWACAWAWVWAWAWAWVGGLVVGCCCWGWG